MADGETWIIHLCFQKETNMSIFPTVACPKCGHTAIWLTGFDPLKLATEFYIACDQCQVHGKIYKIYSASREDFQTKIAEAMEEFKKGIFEEA